MTKILPLSLLVLSLVGCSAIQKAQSLTSGGITPFLARSVTLADSTGSGSSSSAILVWGTAPASLVRSGGSLPDKSNFSLSGATVTDSEIQAGQAYAYTAKFGSGAGEKTIVRNISTTSSANLQAPELTAPLPVSASVVTPTTDKNPTITWTSAGSPSGFLVTVNSLDGLSGTSNPDAAGTPVYTAFIDAAKHLSGGTYSLTFGAKSDLASFSDDVITALKAADGNKGRFDTKDDGVAALEAGKAYAVLVLPISSDDGAINIGFGKPSLGNWLVQ